MEFRTHIDNIQEIKEQGERVKLVLKNGLVIEDKVINFRMVDNYIYHFTRER